MLMEKDSTPISFGSFSRQFGYWALLISLLLGDSVSPTHLIGPGWEVLSLLPRNISWRGTCGCWNFEKSRTWSCLGCVLGHSVLLFCLFPFIHPPRPAPNLHPKQSLSLLLGSYMPERLLIISECKGSSQGWKSQMQKSGFCTQEPLPLCVSAAHLSPSRMNLRSRDGS